MLTGNPAPHAAHSSTTGNGLGGIGALAGLGGLGALGNLTTNSSGISGLNGLVQPLAVQQNSLLPFFQQAARASTGNTAAEKESLIAAHLLQRMAQSAGGIAADSSPNAAVVDNTAVATTHPAAGGPRTGCGATTQMEFDKYLENSVQFKNRPHSSRSLATRPQAFRKKSLA